MGAGAQFRPYTRRQREVYQTWLRNKTYKPRGHTEVLTWVAKDLGKRGRSKAYLALRDKDGCDQTKLMEDALGKQGENDHPFTWKNLALSFMPINPGRTAKMVLPSWLQEKEFQLVLKSIDDQMKQMRSPGQGFPKIAKGTHRKEETNSELDLSHAASSSISQMSSDAQQVPVSPLPPDSGTTMSSSFDISRQTGVSGSSNAGPTSYFEAGSEGGEHFSAWIEPQETSQLPINQLPDVSLDGLRSRSPSPSALDRMKPDMGPIDARTI